MRFKYLAILTTVSMLSLGFVAACSNSCTAKTKAPEAGAANQINPCAAKTNPCASKK